MNTFSCIFEFRTYVSERIPDIGKKMKTIPPIGSNIWFDKRDVKFPPNMPKENWFKVESIDYLFHDDVYIISLKALDKFEVEE